MERYTRYTDSKGRLFVVLARLAKPEIESGHLKLIPTTVELLDVNAEKTVEMTHGDFEKYIKEGYLKRLSK